MIYLCKPTGVVLGVLNGIEEDTASLKYDISDAWELSFDLNRYIDGKETAYYSSTTEMMELLYDNGEEKIRFQIDSEPVISGDGRTEKKSVVAHSIECELQTKFLHNFKINCGTSESQEYLVGYYNDNKEFVQVNINPYTQLPIDYIVVQNDFVTSLAKVKQEIAAMDLRINSSTGLVQNLDLYDYLYNLTIEYPRLCCDIVNDKTNVYLNAKVSFKNTYNEQTETEESTVLIEEVYVCGNHTKQYLLSGIDSLIGFYEVYAHQLSLIDLAIENAQASGWTVGEIPENLRHKKFNFDIDSQDILSFLKQKISQTLKVIVDFDRYNRQVKIVDIANHDEEFDTGVYLTFRNLLNSIDIQSSSDDGIRTKFIPTGANNLGVLYANFGENYILNLDWFMNKINEYGEYQYVSEELRTKYYNWIRYRESTPVSYTINGQHYNYLNRREAYRKLTRIYNQYLIDIDLLKYRVPNDGCNIDYTTFSFDELNIAYSAYMSAKETLIELYKKDVGAVTFEESTQEAYDASGQLVKTNIKDTWYWYDFAAYFYTIIPNVENALRMYVLTDQVGTLDPNNPLQYDSDTGKWIEHIGGNPWYNTNTKNVSGAKSVNFLYDMSLYGVVELESKKKAWEEAASTLLQKGTGFILRNGTVVESNYIELDDECKPINGYSYNTPDDNGWARLTTSQQAEWSKKQSFIDYLTEYLNYVSYNNLFYNSLTKEYELDPITGEHGTSNGVIPRAQIKINELKKELEGVDGNGGLEGEKNNIYNIRKALSEEVILEDWPQFTEDDIRIIHTLIREANYNNNNILTTNLDTIVTAVNAHKELYDDAVIALSEKAQPQLSFSIDLDNLFALDEFKCFTPDVKLLNFIRISTGLYDDYFVKLRVVSIEKNPLIPSTNIELGFSNMTYSLQGASDLAYMFDLKTGGSSGSSGGSSGGGGAYGANDAEITIGNNMLDALLKQFTYSSAVGIKTGPYGTYNNGMTLANNILDMLLKSDAFKDVFLKSLIEKLSNNETNLTKLFVTTGVFKELTAGNVIIDGECISNHIKSKNYNGTISNPFGNTQGSYLDLAQGYLNFGGGNIKYDQNGLSLCKGGITYDGTTLDIANGGIVYDGSNLTIEADTLKIGPRNVQDMIDEAASVGSEAAKTATNYLYYDPNLGLVIGNNPQSANVGYNVLLRGSSIDLRYNTSVYTRINTNGFYIFDGEGIDLNNNTRLRLESSYARIGSAYGPHVIIGEGGIEMYKDDTSSLMSIYLRTDGKVNTDITGDYCINGTPVLTESGLKGKLEDIFYIKVVQLLTGRTIVAGGKYEDNEPVSYAELDGYIPIGIVGHNIYNAVSAGQAPKINVSGLYLGAERTWSDGSKRVPIFFKLRNTNTNKDAKISMKVYLLCVKSDITIPITPTDDDDQDDD